MTHPGPERTTLKGDLENGANIHIGSRKYVTPLLELSADMLCLITLEAEDVAEFGEGVWPIRPGL